MLGRHTTPRWIAAVILGGVVGGIPDPQWEDPALGNVLDRMELVARLYSDAALRFTCRETITAKPSSLVRRFDYVYIFGEDGKFRDYRTRAGAGSAAELELEDAGLPRWLNQAFSWAFIFRPNRRPHFRFSSGGEVALGGRRAVQIRFEPVLPIYRDLNDWYGTIWIDRSTSQILRVEAQTPDDFEERGRFDRRQAAASTPALFQAPDHFSFETITTEFGVVKNGMTFPSQVALEKLRYSIPGRGGKPFDTRLEYRVEQTYDDYRFFSVRTSDEIRALLSRSRQHSSQTSPAAAPAP